MFGIKKRLVALVIAVFFLLAVSIDSEVRINRESAISLFSSDEKPSPYDWIKEEQIRLYNNRVVIEIKNPKLAAFTDTNSMDPVIDENSNAIEIMPKSYNDIHIGDVISYESEFAEGIIIHRVIDIGYDENGWFAIVKSDNSNNPDPGRIRFSQIKRILVAVIY